MLEKLEDIKCEPCEGGVEVLLPEEAWDLQRSTPDWSISLIWPNKLPLSCIRREFKFSNFAQALKLVNKIGKIAEKEGHHPDIEFGWGYVKLVLLTHAIGGLSTNDFIVAAKIDKAAKRMK